MQAFPSPRPVPLTPSPLVPLQMQPTEVDEDGVGTERPPVPAPRAEPGGWYGLPGGRTRAAQSDAVVFTASCPACGADCDWTEEREDTRLRTVVRCPCG